MYTYKPERLEMKGCYKSVENGILHLYNIISNTKDSFSEKNSV